jgi:hypothetical protein
VLGGQVTPPVVGVGEAEVAVEAVDGAVEGLEDAVDEVTLDAELFLELDADGDVAFAGHVAHEAAGHVGDGRDGGLDVVGGAVAAEVDQFADPLPALGDGVEVGLDLFLLERGAQERIGSAQDLFDAVAGGGLEGRVDDR